MTKIRFADSDAAHLALSIVLTAACVVVGLLLSLEQMS